MNSLFDYFVANHNLYLTGCELDGIRTAVRQDIIPPSACSDAARAAAAIEEIWGSKPATRVSRSYRSIWNAVAVLKKIVGLEVHHG